MVHVESLMRKIKERDDEYNQRAEEMMTDEEREASRYREKHFGELYLKHQLEILDEFDRRSREVKIRVKYALAS
ncbi:hypothetical protein HYW76_00025 [Candidatus Pacearchaeota archaeon]|nr:hypothetical protein [Candidatus Pacearchaeota archaeon]